MLARCRQPLFLAALWALAVCSTPGCKRKDAKACENAMSVTRQALAAEDFALAKQWRDHAYKNCDDGVALQALDKEIVDKQAEVEKKKAQEEATKRETDQLVKLFTGWIGQHRATPAGAAVNVVCSAGDEEKKERWCDRERSVGDKYKVKVRYWEAAPEAIEFTTVAPGPLKCDDLGPSSVLSEKAGGAQLHCQITGGPASGLQALIRHAKDGTHVNVVSQQFIDRHSGFRKLL